MVENKFKNEIPHKSPHAQKLRAVLLKNPWHKAEITIKIRTYLELNDKIGHRNLGDGYSKAFSGGTVTTFNAHKSETERWTDESQWSECPSQALKKNSKYNSK